MRTVHYIGRAGCGMCEDIMEHVVAPLMARYPDNVVAHYGWDSDMERINNRKPIDRVPLFVVENGGEEEFRFSGRLTLDEIEDIVTYDGEVLTLGDVLEAAL